MRRFAVVCVLIAACCVVGAPAYSEKGAEPSEQENQVRWQARFRAAQDEVDRARQRYEVALEAYELMRHRKRRRGEAKRVIVEEWKLSAAALPVTERRLEELHTKARRAGIPRGWSRIQPRASAPAAPDPDADGFFDP